MRVRTYTKYGLVFLLMCMSLFARGEELPYLCEIGVQAGCGYYVGDATPHIFQDVRETYGLHFRYKFTKRWAVQVKGLAHRITGNNYDAHHVKTGTKWENQMVNIDVMGEFNFLRYGSTAGTYDKRLHPYTPYIFLGVGAGIYSGDAANKYAFNRVAAYIPLGIGFKWKFADWCGLNIAWQHNIYIADNLENGANLDNTYDLNGSNWMNCDVTGQLTVGIVFEFGKAHHPCVICNY